MENILSGSMDQIDEEMAEGRLSSTSRIVASGAKNPGWNSTGKEDAWRQDGRDNAKAVLEVS